MTIEELTTYCLAKAGATTRPYKKSETLFEVGKKIFLSYWEEDGKIWASVKSDHERADTYKQLNEHIQTAYSFGKSQWLMFILDGEVPEDLKKQLIDESYDSVFSSLTKKLQKEILENG